MNIDNVISRMFEEYVRENTGGNVDKEFKVEDYNSSRPSFWRRMEEEGDYHAEKNSRGEMEGSYRYMGKTSQPCLDLENGSWQTRIIICAPDAPDGWTQETDWSVSYTEQNVSRGPANQQMESFASDGLARDAAGNWRKESIYKNAFKFPGVVNRSSSIVGTCTARFRNDITKETKDLWVKWEWSYKDGVISKEYYAGEEPAPKPEPGPGPTPLPGVLYLCTTGVDENGEYITFRKVKAIGNKVLGDEPFPPAPPPPPPGNTGIGDNGEGGA